MTKTKEKTTTKQFVEQAETQLNEWLDYFNNLEDTIDNAGTDIQQAYHERIVDLKQNLHQVEERLSDLKSSDSNNWEDRKYRFQQASWTYTQSYATLVSDMKEGEHGPAGWLEGFTDQPPAGSAGWLEGTGAHATGSEGWVEGMAERSPESKGWKEGYHTGEPA